MKSKLFGNYRGAGNPGQLNIVGQTKDKIKNLLDQIKSLKDQVKGVKDNIPVIGAIKEPKPDKADKDDKKPVGNR